MSLGLSTRSLLLSISLRLSLSLLLLLLLLTISPSLSTTVTTLGTSGVLRRLLLLSLGSVRGALLSLLLATELLTVVRLLLLVLLLQGLVVGRNLLVRLGVVPVGRRKVRLKGQLSAR